MLLTRRTMTPRADPARRRSLQALSAAPLWARGLIGASALAAGMSALAQTPARTPRVLRVTLLVPANDPRLERVRIERGSPGHPTGPAADSLKMALAEGQAELDPLGLRLELETTAVSDAASARQAVMQADKPGRLGFVADLPTAWLLAAADATTTPILNIGSAADRLRQADCRRHVWHLVPSDRMRADAVAQFLAVRRWAQVLLLVGPSDEDAERGATALAALQRHGLKTVARKPFKLSADPRERDLVNPLLLTGPSVGAYDVVWVVDSDGEFAQSLPYRTALPRPVVGDAGLSALAWSRHFERYGAPQVTRRLVRAAGRPMGAHDWVAWMAGKTLVAAAAISAAASTPAAFAKALGELELDGSKGTTMSFRAWDGQLRQPLVLGDGQGVAALAPLEGVLHPRETLDSLGADAPERLCKARA